MAIHDTKRPEALEARKVFLDEITILIGFSHLRDKARPSFKSKLLDWFLLIILSSITWVLDSGKLTIFSVWNYLDLRAFLLYWV